MTGRGRYSPANLIRSENLRPQKGACIHLKDRLADPDEKQRWQQRLQDSSVPRVIDLFAGAGGMSEGFINADFTIAAALDQNKYACETFAANIPARVICTDIVHIEDPAQIMQDLDYSSIDIIVGGPPCQGFSTIGQARIRSLKEEKQRVLLARNELYQQYFRFIEYFHPAFFVMENVPALKSFDNGAYYKGIQDECNRLGYVPKQKILNVADYGVPQNRKRLFIVGIQKDDHLFNWPIATHKDQPIRLLDAIDDLPEVQAPSLVERLPYELSQTRSEYQKLMRSRVPEEEKEYIYDHLVRPVREDDRQIFTLMRPGDRYIDIPEEYWRYNPKTFKDRFYKLCSDKPSVTITAHMDKDGYRYIHWDPAQCRTLSVREAARIQSFGDHFRFAGFRSSRFRQIGNAVPPLMAEKIAQQVMQAFKISKGLVEATSQLGLDIPGQLELDIPGY